jgi:predicted acylesterase/phospholipase RssA
MAERGRGFRHYWRMTEQIRLKGKTPEIDPNRIGISYSGGGPLVLIELGCAKAFVERGIVPFAIAGVSAGALAGTAHALDPAGGKGIDLAVRLLGEIRASDLGFGWIRVGVRLLRERAGFTSIADHRKISRMINDGIEKTFGITSPTVGSVGDRGGVKLLIAATDRLNGTSLWYPSDMPIGDALLASSSIPGVFPWQDQLVGEKQYTLVDGGVITNQPLSNLAEEGCGTLFACAVGYGGEVVARPTNALNNVLPTVFMMMHQTMKLEEDYVRLKIRDQGGKVHHIHPDVAIPIHGYDFDAREIGQVVEKSRQLTREWLDNLPAD